MQRRVLAVAVMLLVSVVLTNGGTGASYAAGKKETSETKPVQDKERKKGFDAHETYVRYHFKDSDMDFTFGSMVLGATVNHGCEIGGAFRTAAGIKDGDAASWQEEWANEGVRLDPAKVAVPALVIVGEGEYKSEEVKRQQKICMDNLPNPRKKLVVTPAIEGAANHCVMENRSLVSQVLFD